MQRGAMITSQTGKAIAIHSIFLRDLIGGSKS
jgi:hypothetical protein